jgi:hypothetical protein
MREAINRSFKKKLSCANNDIKSLCSMTDTLDKNLMCWKHDAIRNISQVRYFERGVELLLDRGAWNCKLLPMTFNSLVPYMHDRSAAGPPPQKKKIFMHLGPNGSCCILKTCCTFSVLSSKQFYILGGGVHIIFMGRSSRFYQ